MTIYIDPQHGGIDAGLQHNTINEKDIALASGLALKNAITKHKTIISRDTDILAIQNDPERTHGKGSIDTQYRADQANKHKVDLFIGLGVYDKKLRDKYKTDGRTPIILTMHKTSLISKVIAQIPDAKVVEYDKVLFKPFRGLTDPHYYQLMLLNMDAIIVLMGDITTFSDINQPEDIIKKLADGINSI
jgi:hypothetical protein